MTQLTESVSHRIRGYREGNFDQHASIEAINAAMRDASRAESMLSRHLGWLEYLKNRRKHEIENGTWPLGSKAEGEGQ